MRKQLHLIAILLIMQTLFSHAQEWEHIPLSFDAVKVYSSPEDVLVMGAPQATVPSYISTDGGASWNQIFTNKPIMSAEFGPDGTIYLITGKKLSALYFMDSLFSSNDGLTWTNLGKIPFGGSASDYKEPSYVVTGNNTLLFPWSVGPGEPYLSKSVDNGLAWTNTAFTGNIRSVSASPDAQSITIGTYNSGVYYSGDGGATFNASTGGWGNVTVGGMVHHPGGDIYAAAYGVTYKSTDGGQTFTNNVPVPWIGLTITEFDYAPSNNNFYIRVLNGIWETPDCISHTAITATLPDYNQIKDMAISNNYVYAITNVNLYRYEIANTSAVNEKEEIAVLATISPNPSAGSFRLNYDQSVNQDEIRIDVFNERGEKVFHADHATTRIDLEGLPGGIYYASFIAGNKSETQKIIILK